MREQGPVNIHELKQQNDILQKQVEKLSHELHNQQHLKSTEDNTVAHVVATALIENKVV